jgi:quinol monooxygenase YgiN
MIGVIAKLTIKPGTNADFERTMKALQARVQADEPGNKLYALHKTADVNVYVMLERYEDQAALEAHRAAPHFREIGRKLGDYLVGRPDVQMMQEV